MSNPHDNVPMKSDKKGSFLNWKGYFVAMVTPFHADFSIDRNGIRKLIHWHLANGVHGIVVAGTTGEWFSLTQQERIELFSYVRQEVPATTPLIAGCSSLLLQESQRFMDVATQLQLDGILLTPPPYIIPTDEEILVYYQTLTKNCRLPIIVYNWPLGVGREMGPELLEKLIELEPIVAIKNSTPDLAIFLSTLRLLHDRCKIFGIMPSDLGIGILQNIGGDGCIGAAGVLGSTQPQFYEAVWTGEIEQAAILGRKDQILMQSLFTNFKGKYGHAISTFKHILTLLGLPAGPVRPPLLPISPHSQPMIKQVLADLELT